MQEVSDCGRMGLETSHDRSDVPDAICTHTCLAPAVMLMAAGACQGLTSLDVRPDKEKPRC